MSHRYSVLVGQAFQPDARQAGKPDLQGLMGIVALGLIVCAGCGDIGGNRRQASGSVAGTGLVGSDINSLAAGPSQPAASPAMPPAGAPAMTGPVPGAAPQGQPAGTPVAGQPAGVPGPQPAAQPGSLPGLPGVGVPGQPQPNVVTEKAQAGVTGKGNYGPGVVTTPISVYFTAQELITFDKVTYCVKLYEAEHGYKPKTEEEFMKQIIEFNQIRLPQLSPGSKYKYDPQTGELMVEHPQK